MSMNKSLPAIRVVWPTITNLWLAGLIILCFTSGVRAQTFRGVILGTVTDQSMAPIPGATVTVKNQATGLTRTTPTDDEGQYNVPELPIGTYTVTAEKEGFGAVTQGDVTVDVAAERRVDMHLAPAKLEQAVEVHADVPLVTTTE